MTNEAPATNSASAEPQNRQRVGVMVDMEIHDEAAFRQAAYERALEDGLEEENAREYLDAEQQSLESCAVMLIDPGTSPAGSSIIQSEGM